MDKVVHFNHEFSHVYRETRARHGTDDLIFVAVYDEETGEVLVDGRDRESVVNMLVPEEDDLRLSEPASNYVDVGKGSAFWLMVGRTTDDAPYVAAVAATFRPMTRGGEA